MIIKLITALLTSALATGVLWYVSVIATHHLWQTAAVFFFFNLISCALVRKLTKPKDEFSRREKSIFR